MIWVLFVFSVFASGWVNVEKEIAKSVAENSPKSLDVSNESATTTINMDFSDTSITSNVSKKHCHCHGSYALIEFWSAQTVRQILNGYGKHDKLFLGFMYEQKCKTVSYPKKMKLGTYTLSDYGIYDIPLAFLTVETNATLLITVNDHGRLVDKKGDTISSQHAFLILNDNLKSFFKGIVNGSITASNVDTQLMKTLFAKPKDKDFSSPSASVQVSPPAYKKCEGSPYFTLLSWWLRVFAERNTPAAVYVDTVTITIMMKPNF